MNKPPESSHKAKKHFSGTIAAAFVLLIVCVGGMIAVLGRYNQQDEAAYQKIMQSQDDPREANAYTSRQQRLGVQKDVFFVENGQRLQMRLKSARAELALDHHDAQTEIVEHLNDVTCYIQEELFYQLSDGREASLQSDGRLLIAHADPKEAASWMSPENASIKPMQVVRFVEADTAFYYYKNSQFIAENVRVMRYVAAGHSIDQAAKSVQPIMSGLASWVEFSLGGNGIDFKAYQLKAKFFASERGL